MVSRKIEELPDLPAAPGDLDNIYFGLDNLNNATSYRASYARVVRDSMPFATVAAMQAGTHNDGDTINTLAYTAAGGGANEYTYNGTGRTGVTTDGGRNITGLGADDYFAASSIKNVQQFGAVGNGVTDDTAAIAAAKADAITNGIELRFPPGTYLVSGGAGASAIDITATDSLVIRGEGAAKIKGDDAMWGIRIREGSGLDMEGLHLEDFKHAIHFSDSTVGTPHGAVEIRNCKVTSCEYGINDPGTPNDYYTTVSISDCDFDDFTEGGIQIRSRSAENIRVVNTRVTNVASPDTTSGARGIGIGANIKDENSAVQVHGCYVSDIDNATTTNNTCFGIIIYGEHGVVSDCTVRNVTTSNDSGNLNCAGIYTKTRFGRISDNHVYLSGTKNLGSISVKGGDRDEHADPGTAVAGWGMTVVGNTVLGGGLGYKGILNQAEETVISGNVVEGCEEAIISSTADGSIISNNRVRDAKFGIQSFQSSRMVITDNICDWNSDTDQWEGPQTACIFVNQNPDNAADKQILIANNVCQGFETDAASGKFGIRIVAGVDPVTGSPSTINDIRVTGNLVRDCDTGIQLEQTSRLSNLQVERNSTHNCTVDENFPTWNVASAVESTDQLTFEDVGEAGTGNERRITMANLRTSMDTSSGAARTFDTNNQDLIFNNITNFDVNAASAVVLDSPGTVIRHPTTSLAGILQLRTNQTAGSSYLAQRAATGMTSTYTITWPGLIATSSTQVLGISSIGGGEVRLDWVTNEGGGGGSGDSRKDGADNLGSGGTTTIDFETGSFDNKVRVVNANSTITLAQPTRGGEYTLYLSSDVDGTKRTLAWVADGSANFDDTAQGHLPGFVNTDKVLKVELEYDHVAGLWNVEPVFGEEQIADATAASGDWTLDHGYGVGRHYLITGAVPSGVTLKIPSNMAINQTMKIHFRDPQVANPPTFDAAFEVLGTSPTWADQTVIIIHRTSHAYLLCAADNQ